MELGRWPHWVATGRLQGGARQTASLGRNCHMQEQCSPWGNRSLCCEDCRARAGRGLKSGGAGMDGRAAQWWPPCAAVLAASRQGSRQFWMVAGPCATCAQHGFVQKRYVLNKSHCACRIVLRFYTAGCMQSMLEGTMRSRCIGCKCMSWCGNHCLLLWPPGVLLLWPRLCFASSIISMLDAPRVLYYHARRALARGWLSGRGITLHHCYPTHSTLTCANRDCFSWVDRGCAGHCMIGMSC